MNNRNIKSRLTKTIINERLSDSGISIIGNYLNAHTKALFKCREGHEWESPPQNILKRQGCPVCSKKIKLTENDVNERLRSQDRGIQMIGKYSGLRVKTTFKCKNEHNWDSLPANVIRGSGCPKCANNILLTKDLVKSKIHPSIKMIGEYVNARTKTKFKHECGFEWSSTPDNIIRGKGCPKCASYGFNPEKSATVYLLKFDKYLKYGITNDLNRRLTEHKRNNGNYSIVMTKFFENGSRAREIETMIKKIFSDESNVASDQCPDGWTETLPVCLINDVIGIITDHHSKD